LEVGSYQISSVGKSLLILFLSLVGLEYAGNADPAGVDLLSFQDRFDRSEGRISGLGSIEEVSFGFP
jgi:hypothetical protein